MDKIEALSKLEIRILYELSVVLIHLKQKEQSNKIIELMVKNLDTKWDFYGEILCQHSISLSRKNKLLKSLEYINKAIAFSKGNMFYKNLPVFYYNKAIIKLKMDDKSYSIDLKKSLELSELMGLNFISQSIKNKCEKFGIKI